MTVNVRGHFRIPRLIILLLFVLSTGPSQTASIGVGKSHPFSALRSSSPSGLLVASVGLAALLAHSPAVPVSAEEASFSSQQACPGLNLRPSGRVAMAPSAGGAGTCSERGGDPVRVEAVRGQTLELTSALNLRANSDQLVLSMIHWYNSHELKWENDYSPIAAEPWPGALPTALAEPRSRFNATARYVLNAATSERTLESSLTVRDLTSRAHFSTIYSTFTFTHEEDTCHFSTCFFLSVWVAPSPPEILGFRNGSTTLFYEGDSLSFVCEARNGRLPPNLALQWTLSGEALAPSSAMSATQLSPAQVDRSYADATRRVAELSRDVAPEPPLEPLVSEVRLSFADVRWDASGFARLRCTLPRYDVLGDPSRPLLYRNTFYEITLVKALLPSPPVIIGHEHKVYHAGATVTLSCVTSGGTPAPQVVWTKRALELPDRVGAPQWVRVAQSRARSDHPTETRSDITFAVAKEDNNIEFRCEVVASSRKKDMFNATVRLQVGYEPHLFGERDVLLPSMNLGDVLRASCFAHGFPAPSMRFHLLAPQGHPFKADARDSPANATVSDSYVSMVPSDEALEQSSQRVFNLRYGYMRNASLALPLGSTDYLSREGLLRVKCEASNAYGRDTKEFQVTVNVPPSRVVLRALFERRELELGVVNGERRLELSSWLATAVQFECDAVGASTAPTFTWNVLMGNNGSGSSVLSERGWSNRVGISSTWRSTSDLAVGRQYHNALIQCKVQHPALREPMQYIEDAIRLSIRFLPTQVLLNYLPREPREDGDPVKVGCAAINSNPPAALTLTKVCTPISEEIAQVERVEHFPSSSVETIPLSDPLWKPSTLAAPMAPPAAVPGTAIAEAEAPSQAVPGLVPGYHSLTWWQLRVAGPDDGCFLTCRATVDARNDAPIEEKTIRLSVLGVPRMVPVLAPLLPHEGQPFDQEFPLLANPAVPNEQLTWTRNGAPFTADSSRTLRPYRNRLRATSIQRADSGNYTLNATNAIGFALLHIELIVQYAPDIATQVGQPEAQQGIVVKFTCVVDAVPRPTIAWTNENPNLCKTTDISSSRYERTCDISVTSGFTYECTASNSIGRRSQAASILVLAAPQTRAYISNFVPDEDSKVDLECIAKANPKPVFEWRKLSGSEVQMLHQDKEPMFYPESEQYLSRYQLQDVGEKELGTYECIATNKVDSSSAQMQLSRSIRVPEPASSLRVSNVSTTSAELEWLRGSDGGDALHFEFLLEYSELIGGRRGQLSYSLPIPSRRPRPDASPSEKLNNRVVYPLKGLHSGKEYEIIITASNSAGKSAPTKPLRFTTRMSEADRVSPRPGAIAPAQSRSDPTLLGPGDLPLVIIAGVCIAAVLLLVLNVFVICICVNRKPKANRQSFRKGSDGQFEMMSITNGNVGPNGRMMQSNGYRLSDPASGVPLMSVSGNGHAHYPGHPRQFAAVGSLANSPYGSPSHEMRPSSAGCDAGGVAFNGGGRLSGATCSAGDADDVLFLANGSAGQRTRSANNEAGSGCSRGTRSATAMAHSSVGSRTGTPLHQHQPPASTALCALHPMAVSLDSRLNAEPTALEPVILGGKTYYKVDQSLDILPDELFHNRAARAGLGECLEKQSIGMPTPIMSASPFHQSACGTPEAQRMAQHPFTPESFSPLLPPHLCTHAGRPLMMRMPSSSGMYGAGAATSSWAPCSSGAGPQQQYPYLPASVVCQSQSQYPSQLASVPQSAIVAAVTSMSFMHPRPSAPLECAVPAPPPPTGLAPAPLPSNAVSVLADVVNTNICSSPLRERNGVPVGYSFQVPKSSAFSVNGGHDVLSFHNGSIECFSDDSSALGGSGSISAYQHTPGITAPSSMGGDRPLRNGGISISPGHIV